MSDTTTHAESPSLDLPHTPRKNSAQLTNGRLLARNTLWNLLGIVAPMLVGIGCIPIVIRALGKDRFGVLTLAWALIGYASLFEFGLGRALTQIVASKLGKEDDREIPALAWTSLFLMLLLGMVGTASILLLSSWLVKSGLNVPAPLYEETLQSFRLLTISIPFVVTTAGLRGLLEAHQRFALVNWLRIPMGVLTYAGPLLVLPFARGLVPVIITLVASRILIWAAHLAVCLRVLPELRHSVRWDGSLVVPLLRFGGWMTVSSVISPLMVTLDRFLIGAFVSMTAVAYYTTPYEVVTRSLVLSGALMGVLFPAFSSSFGHDKQRTALLFNRSVKAIVLIMFPLMLCAVVLAQDGLRLWLGAEFAQNSYRVVQWLALGVLLNSLAQVPFGLLQGAGRPDLTAKLHLLELPIYVAVLWSLIRTRGIEGAAIAWTVRMALDALLLFILAARFLPRHQPRFRAAALPVLTLLVLLLAVFIHGPAVKATFLLATIVSFAMVSWFRVLTPEERAFALSYR